MLLHWSHKNFLKLQENVVASFGVPSQVWHLTLVLGKFLVQLHVSGTNESWLENRSLRLWKEEKDRYKSDMLSCCQCCLVSALLSMILYSEFSPKNREKIDITQSILRNQFILGRKSSLFSFKTMISLFLLQSAFHNSLFFSIHYLKTEQNIKGFYSREQQIVWCIWNFLMQHCDH